MTSEFQAMQKDFIESIKNLDISAEISQQKLASLVSAQFPFDAFQQEIIGELEQVEHRWSIAYFTEKCNDLSHNFSKELCEHLLIVKHYINTNLDKRSVKPSSSVLDSQEINNQSTTQESTTVHNAKQTLLSTDNIPAEILNKLSSFSISEPLKSFITAMDIDNIRTQLITVINNRRMSVTDSLLSILAVHRKVPSAFEEFKISAFGPELDLQESHWDVDYYYKHESALNYNFSLERALHLINVRESLIKQGVKEFLLITPTKKQNTIEQKQTPASNSTPTSQSKHTSQSSWQSSTVSEPQSNNRFVKTVLFIGGAVMIALLALLAAIK